MYVSFIRTLLWKVNNIHHGAKEQIIDKIIARHWSDSPGQFNPRYRQFHGQRKPHLRRRTLPNQRRGSSGGLWISYARPIQSRTSQGTFLEASCFWFRIDRWDSDIGMLCGCADGPCERLLGDLLLIANFHSIPECLHSKVSCFLLCWIIFKMILDQWLSKQKTLVFLTQFTNPGTWTTYSSWGNLA